MTALEIYQQSLDKQRILIVGEGRTLIASLIEHVLTVNQRRFDSVLSTKPATISNDASVLVIEADQQLTDYKHHILIFGVSASGNSLTEFENLANQTPKSGTIIYPKNSAALASIGSRERTDVQSISYDTYKHEVQAEKTVLITSTKERFEVALKGDTSLQCVSAAKELLKKIGISSSKFYTAISSYKS